MCQPHERYLVYFKTIILLTLNTLTKTLKYIANISFRLITYQLSLSGENFIFFFSLIFSPYIWSEITWKKTIEIDIIMQRSGQSIIM